MIIDYKSEIAAEAQAHAAAEKTEANDAVWREIIRRYPVRDIQANRQMVEDYSPNGILSIEVFSYLAKHMPTGFTLVWSTEKAIKVELINAIFERSSQNGAVPEFSKASMSSWSLRQLRDRFDELVRRNYFKQFPADTLKAAIAEQRKKDDASKWYFDRNGMKWPRLFSNIVPPGCSTTMATSEYLRHVSRTPAAGVVLRDLVNKHGAEQVNNFLTL